jgi:hypothetical protein
MLGPGGVTLLNVDIGTSTAGVRTPSTTLPYESVARTIGLLRFNLSVAARGVGRLRHPAVEGSKRRLHDKVLGTITDRPRTSQTWGILPTITCPRATFPLSPRYGSYWHSAVAPMHNRARDPFASQK